MKPQKKNTVQKIEYKKIGFDLKLSIIDQISNGQISLNHVLSCMDFCFNNLLDEKLRSFEQNSKTMNQELKKLKERIEELNSLKTFNK
jgi:hypothetical protein